MSHTYCTSASRDGARSWCLNDDNRTSQNRMFARAARRHRRPKTLLLLFVLFALTNPTIAISPIKILLTSILGSSNTNNDHNMSTKEFIQTEVADHDVCSLMQRFTTPCFAYITLPHFWTPITHNALYLVCSYRSSSSPNPTVRIARLPNKPSKALAAPTWPFTNWIKWRMELPFRKNSSKSLVNARSPMSLSWASTWAVMMIPKRRQVLDDWPHCWRSNKVNYQV